MWQDGGNSFWGGGDRCADKKQCKRNSVLTADSSGHLDVVYVHRTVCLLSASLTSDLWTEDVSPLHKLGRCNLLR